MTEPLRTRIERGAKLLDERVPGWRERIDLDRLDMGNSLHCILGQCFGSYFDGLRTLDLSTDSAYGFLGPGTAAWREYLTEAKEEA